MRALVVDLNNFSRYPTMSVGLIASILRGAGIRVDVLSPFALGVDGYPRRTRPAPWDLAIRGLGHWAATTSLPQVRRLRRGIADAIRPPPETNHRAILEGVTTSLDAGADVVLVSAYTMYFDVCQRICALASARGVPVLVGGNYFSEPAIVERWLGIEGLTAVYSGEPEAVLVDLVNALAGGGDPSKFPGVSTHGSPAVPAAPSLRDLDAVPFADYGDFPWEKYPNRIIPMMSGRGCGWGACTFCGDVVTSAGRRFRSRTPDNVLEEMAMQRARHGAKLFTFLDLKLNSDLAVWKALAERAQCVVPGAQWTASLHADARGSDGLEACDLREARAGGLVRLTTGLESGSERVLGAMAKGTDPERTSRVLRNAHAAGISIRLTVVVGYPGERAEDVAATTRFLERHRRLVDRVVVNRLALMLGSGLHRDLEARPARYPEISRAALDPHTATLEHHNDTFSPPSHRRAVWGLLREVHRINRRPLSAISREFEGVM